LQDSETTSEKMLTNIKIQKFTLKRLFSSEFMSLALLELNRIITDKNKINELSIYNFTDKDIIRNRELMLKYKLIKNHQFRSINWFIPPFLTPFAGINNILSFCRFFAEKNIEQRLILVGESEEVARLCIKNIKAGSFGEDIKNLEVLRYNSISNLPYSDISIATRWDTAFPVLKFNNTKGKYYFIQDDERLLNPANLSYYLAELSYKFDFIGITNAPQLKDMYEKEFGGKCYYYFPAPDPIFKNTNKQVNKKVKNVWFYARTRSERNGYPLGIAALNEIKRRHPNVEIIFTGEDSFKNVGFKFKRIKIMSKKDIAKLYKICDIGIYLLFSKHTGVIPFELMAAGCIPLINMQDDSEYLRDHYNCIMAKPSPQSIADKFDILYKNINLRKKIIENGYKTITKFNIRQEMEKVYEFMMS